MPAETPETIALKEAMKLAIADEFVGGSSGLDEMADALAGMFANAAFKAIFRSGYTVQPAEATEEQKLIGATRLRELTESSREYAAGALHRAMSSASPIKEPEE